MNTQAKILPDLTQVMPQDILAEIAALRAENAKLKAAKPSGAMKITDKGGLSVYGLGRFPVTLYRSQWEGLAKRLPEIMAFIEANASKLASKD